MKDRKTQEKKNKVNFQIKRVYVGKRPMEEVFGEVIEHIVETNIKHKTKAKQTQA